MGGVGTFIIVLEGAGFVVALVIIIFLIGRRRRIKRGEDFEKRSN
jgi:hypothetical protein